VPEDHWPGVLWCEFCEGLLPCLHSNAIWGRPCNDVQKFVVINAVALLVVRAEYKVDLRMNSFRSDTPHCHEYDEQCTERGGGGGEHILDSTSGGAPLHRLGRCNCFVS